MMKKRLMKSLATLLSVAIVLSGNIQTYASELRVETGSAIDLIVKAGELTYGDFTYTVDENNEITLTKYNGTAANLTIPATINGKKVKEVGPECFIRNKTLKNVVIEEGIETIGKLGFWSCSNMESISIPESMTYIRTCAFEFCTSLKSITVPKDCEFEYYDDNNLPFPNMTGTGNEPFVVKSYTGSKAWDYIREHYYNEENGSYWKPGYTVYYENLDYVPLEEIELKGFEDIALGESFTLEDCYDIIPANADLLTDIKIGCRYTDGSDIPCENGVYTPDKAGVISVSVGRDAGSDRPEMCRKYNCVEDTIRFKVIDTSLINAKSLDITFDNEELTGTETNIVTGKTIRVDISKIQTIDMAYLFDDEDVNETVSCDISDYSVMRKDGASVIKLLDVGTSTLTATTSRSNLTASVTLEVYSTGAESIKIGGETRGSKEIYIEDTEKFTLPIELVTDCDNYDELYDEIEVLYHDLNSMKVYDTESEIVSYDKETGEVTIKSLGDDKNWGETCIVVRTRGKKGAIEAEYYIQVKTKIRLLGYGYYDEMYPNDSWQFEYTVCEEAKGTYYTVLKSKDNSVIEISGDNLVTAKAIGSTEIVFSIYTINSDYLICEEIMPIDVVVSPFDNNNDNNSDNNNDANNNDNTNNTDNSSNNTNDSSENEEVEQATVKLNVANKFVMKKGKSVSIKILKASETGDRISSARVISGKKVISAKVSGSTLKIKAKKNGTAKIKVETSAGATTTLTVKVSKKSVKPSISIKSKVNIEKGEVYKLEYSLKKIPSKGKVTFTSSNKKVATVGKTNGTIKGKKKGSAKIVVKVDGKKVKTIKVTVK